MPIVGSAYEEKQAAKTHSGPSANKLGHNLRLKCPTGMLMVLQRDLQGEAYTAFVICFWGTISSHWHTRVGT